MVVATGAPSFLGERQQAPLPRRDSTTPPPQMKSGFFALRSSFAASSTTNASGADAPGGKDAQRRIGPHVGALHRPVLHVERQRDVRRARAAGGHRLERLAEHARDVGGAVEHRVPLGQRLHQRALVELGQRESCLARLTETSVLMARTGIEDSFASTRPGQDVGRAAARGAFADADLAA